MKNKSCYSILSSHATMLDGIVFRSRLEARWYLFFKSLGLEVCYEPKCFAIEGGIAYKPDFHLPAQLHFPLPWWFEVKPSIESDLTKPELFSSTMDSAIGILTDLPRDDSDDELCKFTILAGPGGDYNYAFCECRYCEVIGFTWEGREDRIGCCCSDERRYGYRTAKLAEAFNNARNTKFAFVPTAQRII